MKIAIIGAGAMGSVYAGLLAEGGNEVHVVDIWQPHIDAISSCGLRVSGASGDRVIQSVQAHSSIDRVGPCDLVIIATKAAGVGAAAKSASGLVETGGLLLTIQNGLGAGERILESLNEDSAVRNNVLLGVAGGFGASVKAPGHVHHNGMQLIRLGEMQGGLTDRVEQVAAVWRDAGFNTRGYEDINQLIWEKFICNVAFSGPCTVFEKTLGELMADTDAWPVALDCAREAFRAAIAKGIQLEFDDPDKYVSEFGNRMPLARPSMYLDHLDRRRSEIDAINGMVCVVSKQLGLPAPVNAVISAIVRASEKEF